MTSIKDKLKGSQGSTDYVKLPIVKTVQLKEDGGESAFCEWNKAEEKNVYSSDNIQGIFIGNAMRLTAFDDNLGKSGGNYFSNYYFNRDKINLFKFDNKIEKVATGNMDEVEKWISTNTTSKMAKKKLCMFVLTSEGLVEVQTNLVIGIDQLKSHKEALTEKYVCLCPQLFSQNNTDISRNAKQILGKFATKNPPRYAMIETMDLISEKDFNSWKADEVIETFKEWKKQQMAGVEPQDEKTAAPTANGRITPNVTSDDAPEYTAADAPPTEDESLPF